MAGPQQRFGLHGTYDKPGLLACLALPFSHAKGALCVPQKRGEQDHDPPVADLGDSPRTMGWLEWVD